MKSNWYKVYNYGKTKNLKKKLRRSDETDHGEFQTQSTQRLEYGYAQEKKNVFLRFSN